jgi:hypothetical protein
MSERVISDPTVAGWELNPDTGYWMWAAGGGSIQDGDTEGQITTWDGDEWTPEGAVVVSGGNVGIGGAPLSLSGTRAYIDTAGDGGGIEIHSGGTRHGQFYSASDGTVNVGSLTAGLNIIGGGSTKISVDADGNVNINGKLFVNGDEVTAGGGGGGFWVEESPGVIKYTGTAKATTLIGTG